MARAGLMLVNLGTPEKPNTPEVRRYLREFLSDPRVIDISPVGRWFLLNFFILPFRPRRAAEAYRKIWTDRGSPLLYHGLDLAGKIAALLGDEIRVELAMRYGNPSIRSVLQRYRESCIDRIVVFPMFPQYSSAAWGSAVEEVFAQTGRLWNVPTIQVVPPFYDQPAFIESFVSVAGPVIEDLRPEKVLMSFHGIPERHIRKSDDSQGAHYQNKIDCCERIVSTNRYCYRAQCFATARGIADGLEIADESYEVTFQSRLGRSPWIKPYTDLRIVELAQQGVRRVAVLCPSFVTDCLETLEEIEIRAREDFIAKGGEELRLVPSLNSEDVWARAIVQMVRATVNVEAGANRVVV